MYSFRMNSEGLQNANTIDSKDTTPRIYSHSATGFEHEGVKSLAQGDIPGSMSEVRTLNLIFVTHTLSSVS